MSPPKQSLGYEAVIKALKAHSNASGTETEEERERGFLDFKNETDRGAVILIATAFEDKVALRLKSGMSHLNADERSRLFGWDGPLGTFSAKLRMAQALGYLDRREFKMAEVVREMRNACAHSRQPISFKEDAVRNAVSVMSDMAEAGVDLSEEDAEIIRVWFTSLVAWLTHCLFSEQKPTFDAFFDAVSRLTNERRSSGKKPPEQPSQSSLENRKGA